MTNCIRGLNFIRVGGSVILNQIKIFSSNLMSHSDVTDQGLEVKEDEKLNKFLEK